MVTAKRLYLYGVLGAALLPLLLGLTDLAQLALRGTAATVGSRDIIGAEMVRDDLSWALALVIVALPIWLIHLWLVRGLTNGTPSEVADERASAARATYFFLVLVGTAVVAGMRVFDLAHEVIGIMLVNDRPWGVAGALAGVIVVGSAWLLHLWWRSRDLGAAPARLAGDWLTRGYLYGALFVLALLATLSIGAVLSVVAQELVDIRPAWETSHWWQEAMVGPLAATLVASTAWLAHWAMAGRLLCAEPPMGEAQSRSKTRTGYFLAAVLLCATAVLVLVSMSLRHVLAGVLGVGQPMQGPSPLDEVAGPLVMAVPFILAWWWHLRRASAEALGFGGPVQRRAVARSGRLLVAFVGLAGLAVGLALELYALLEDFEIGTRGGPLSSTTLPGVATPALAVALVGLAMWTPTWAFSQRERSGDPVEAAGSTSRRAYLLLISGLSVVAMMGSLASLVFGVTRMLLDAGPIEEGAWPASVLIVAALVIAYHLHQLRLDARVARPEESPETTAEAAPLAVETIEIRAPADADFKVLNAAIRTELPEGYLMRVVEA